MYTLGKMGEQFVRLDEMGREYKLMPHCHVEKYTVKKLWWWKLVGNKDDETGRYVNSQGQYWPSTSWHQL